MTKKSHYSQRIIVSGYLKVFIPSSCVRRLPRRELHSSLAMAVKLSGSLKMLIYLK
ncbi:MAG: hypothetical protein IJV35_08140 [Neisseriaceae bacterium]|nr:hypothetical protein [Neisseriaceae bacterium]